MLMKYAEDVSKTFDRQPYRDAIGSALEARE